MTRLEVNVSTGSLVSSLQPAPAEGDGYSCRQPATDRPPAETEHSSSEVVLHRTVLLTLWRALCSRNSCSLIVCKADAKPVRSATLSSQIYISNRYWGWCHRFSSGTYALVYSSSSYSTIPLLGYSSLILEMSLGPFPQTPTDQSVRFNNNNSGLCGANLFAEQLMHYHTPFTHTHAHTHVDIHTVHTTPRNGLPMFVKRPVKNVLSWVLNSDRVRRFHRLAGKTSPFQKDGAVKLKACWPMISKCSLRFAKLLTWETEGAWFMNC